MKGRPESWSGEYYPRHEQTTENSTKKPIKWAFEATKTPFAVISQLEHVTYLCYLFNIIKKGDILTIHAL